MTVPERRAATRRVPEPDDVVGRLRLRTGDLLRVLDVSDRGALVEGLTRLLPGTGIEIQVGTVAGRVATRARVVRSEVARLCSSEVAYRSAVAFEREVDTRAGYTVPRSSRGEGGTTGTVYPEDVAGGRRLAHR